MQIYRRPYNRKVQSFNLMPGTGMLNTPERLEEIEELNKLYERSSRKKPKHTFEEVRQSLAKQTKKEDANKDENKLLFAQGLPSHLGGLEQESENEKKIVVKA